MRDNIFFLDSNHLESVENKLYGYMIVQDSVVEDLNQIPAEFLEGKLNIYGCYTLVQNKDNTITISQDYSGSQGLYLFCKEEYFAISNSFLFLVEKVKKYGLTIDRDNVRCYLATGWLNLAYRKTMVNEIIVLDKDEYITINIRNKKFKIDMVTHRENEIKLDSQEGVDLLDTWYKKWIHIIRKLYSEDKPIDVDLTGGIDSRIVFSLFLNAGINMENINVISYREEVHTHKEDYEIASSIAEKYSFKLNHMQGKYDVEEFDQSERVQIPLYTKIGSHLQFYYRYGRNKKMRYRFTGAGGEKIRGFWNITPEQFKNYEKSNAKNCFTEDYETFCESIDLILDQTFKYIKKKYDIKHLDSEDITNFLYNDIADGRHFGRVAAETYLYGEINLQPLSDPMLQNLKLIGGEITDYKKIVALIFERYMPELLDIKFDSGHMIAKNTIEWARDVNKQFPYTKNVLEQLNRITKEEENIKWNKGVNGTKLTNEWIRSIFYSNHVCNAIAEQLTDSMYLSAYIDCEMREYFPLTCVYPLLFVAYLADQENETMYEYLQKIYDEDAKAPFLGNYKIFVERIRKYKNIKKRDDQIMHLYSRWIANPTAVSNYLSQNGYREIAIYGAGRLGKSLMEEIIKNGYEITFVMDCDTSKKIGSYQAVSIESEWQKCDVIIVTVLYAFEEIKKQLQNKYNCPVVSLMELVE